LVVLVIALTVPFGYTGPCRKQKRATRYGQIVLSGITGTVIATEVESIKGYAIDPVTRSQTVVISPDDTQHLYFYNAPL